MGMELGLEGKEEFVEMVLSMLVPRTSPSF